MMRRNLVATLFLALTSAPPVVAATPVTTCGTVINAAGSYQLAANLVSCTGDGVVVAASNVTLDLAGFSISGVSSLANCNTGAPQSGINVIPGVTNVHVSGGEVTGFVKGVVLYGS